MAGLLQCGRRRRKRVKGEMRKECRRVRGTAAVWEKRSKGVGGEKGMQKSEGGARGEFRMELWLDCCSVRGGGVRE